METQCESIFLTKCTIKRKICSLIIDGGSCTNLASQTLVSKLKPKTIPHPHPYTRQWLNQNNGLKVTHQTRVCFSIGNSYIEELLCDIVLMDACHILLERPWLFDCRVVHDGYHNTYTFTKNNKKKS